MFDLAFLLCHVCICMGNCMDALVAYGIIPGTLWEYVERCCSTNKHCSFSFLEILS